MQKDLISKHQIKQKMACEMVAANPDITNLELSKQLNLDKKTVSKWRNNPLFIENTYKRFMQIAGQELPNLLLALIREGKEGNVRAIELALKHLYQPKTKIIPKELKDLTQLQWILLNHILEELMDEQEDSTIH